MITFLRSILPSPKDATGAAGATAAAAPDATDVEVDDEEAGSGAEQNPVTAASRAFLAGLTEEQRNSELDTEGLEDEDAARPAVAEAATDVDEDEEIDEVEVEPRDDGAIWTKVGTGFRWVKDGKFVDGEPPAGWVAPKPAAAAAAAPPKKNADGTPAKKGAAAAAEPKTKKLVLPGESDRGEEDIEIEVDEDVAERLARLQKGAMRRAVAAKRTKELDERQAELSAIELELDQDPIGFMLSKLSDERRLEVARALLTRHMPQLRDEIDRFLDEEGGETARLRAEIDLRDRMSASEKRLNDAKAARAYAQRCMDAARTLVPDDADDDVVDEFMRDARRELSELANAGTRVTPETVKDLLARRVKLYGFDQTRRSSSTPAPRREAPARDDTRSARPITDRARSVAERRSPTKAEAEVAQSRLRRVQKARAAGSRVTPAGAGAAPVQAPILKPEEQEDVHTASKALRKRLGENATWSGQ